MCVQQVDHLQTNNVKLPQAGCKFSKRFKGFKPGNDGGNFGLHLMLRHVFRHCFGILLENARKFSGFFHEIPSIKEWPRNFLTGV